MTAAKVNSVYAKLEKAQRLTKAIVLTTSDNDGAGSEDPFRYPPADAVLEEARRRLKRCGLIARSSVKACERKVNATWVRVAVRLVDPSTGDYIEDEWVGEATDGERGLSAACTAALKGFYLATFLIPTEDPDDARRRETQQLARQQQVTSGIEHEAHRAGFTGREIDAFLAEHFDFKNPAAVPKSHATRVINAIQKVGEERKAARKAEEKAAAAA